MHVVTLPKWDEELSKRWESGLNEQRRQWQQNRAKQAEEHDAAWWADYNEYLRSPEWKAISRRVLDRAAGLCEGCGIREATQAHHLHYKRVKQEMLFDLVAVCKECHEQIHGRKFD